jgi:hypothetical protein
MKPREKQGIFGAPSARGVLVMMYVGIGLLVVVLALAALVVWGRTSAALGEKKLRDDVRAYVESKGGQVSFDEAGGMTVDGPLGRGHEKLTALRIMLSSKGGDRALTIGFALRKYFPDKFDEMFEKGAAKRLEEARGAIDGLAPDALREKLRVRITSTRTSATGLATCARPVVDGLEARVVLDGFELDGIPTSARAKLAEDDAALFDAALAHTLASPPPFDRAEVEGHAWLAAPARLFGDRRVVAAGCGKKLVWTAEVREGGGHALASLASRSLETGALKGVLLTWDGTALVRVGMRAHTIKGPTTPDFTLDLPPPFVEAFGLVAGPRGEVGVSA